jgi:hypothetical protein
MIRRRRLVRLLAAVGMLVGIISFGNTAGAAAPCTTFTCYRYWADMTVTASTTSSWLPIFPGSLHTYTVRVTNTGWRTGGLSAPVPSPGPTSGTVYVILKPILGVEVPMGRTGPLGVPFGCFGGYPTEYVCDISSVPSNTTEEFTFTFQAPRVLGTYTVTVSVYAFNWTEYNPNNNSATLTYQVGYLA